MTKVFFIAGTAVLGGASLSLFNLVKGLAERGYKCYVAFGTDGPIRERLESLGVECYIVHFRSSSWPHLSTLRDVLLFIPKVLLLLKNYFVYRSLVNLANQIEPDIIHSNYSITTMGYRVAKKMGKPHVWHIREYIDKDFHLTPFPCRKSHYKKLASSEVITITRDLADYFHLPNAHVVYNGIVEDDCQIRENDKQDYFLYVGNVTEMKGALDLLQAFVAFAKENHHTRLLYVGAVNPDVQAEIDSIVKQNRLEGRVSLEGKRNNVREYMERALALVVPSRFEGFGRITAEAMSCGCLVIGKNTGGTKEQFDNGLTYCGSEIGFRYSDTKELEDCLSNILLCSNKELSVIRENAFNTVCHLYTNSNYVAGVISVYEKII